MTTKQWCVHVHTRPTMYEHVRASSAVSAKQLILGEFYDTNSDDVSFVEVMRECGCGYDNDADAKKCDECGAAL